MNFTDLKNFMDRLTNWRIPGNIVSVYQEGKEVFRYSSGYANLETKEKMATNKMVNIYSCTKIATVTAALTLYEKGLFLLDDPIEEYIPAYHNCKMLLPDGTLSPIQTPITFRHLFTHTAGFSYDLNCSAIQSLRNEGKKLTTKNVVEALANEPLLFNPGARWNYSLAHDVLAGVIEVMTGKKFSEYVKEAILDPLEIKNCVFHPEGLEDRIAEEYRYEISENLDDVSLQAGFGSRLSGHIVKEDKMSNRFIFSDEYDSGGAGIICEVPEYAKFVDALANNGLGWNGNRILSASTVSLMNQNQLNKDQYNNFNWKQLKGYGYGLGVRTLVDKAANGSVGPLGEFGWGGAAGANAIIDPVNHISCFYAHHMLNPLEEFYQPRLRNILYTCFTK